MLRNWISSRRERAAWFDTWQGPYSALLKNLESTFQEDGKFVEDPLTKQPTIRVVHEDEFSDLLRSRLSNALRIEACTGHCLTVGIARKAFAVGNIEVAELQVVWQLSRLVQEFDESGRLTQTRDQPSVLQLFHDVIEGPPRVIHLRRWKRVEEQWMQDRSVPLDLLVQEFNETAFPV